MTSQQDKIDLSVASSARVYDYLLGGKDNYEADRKAAALLTERAPSLPKMFRAQRDLVGRIARYLAAECGVRQFLDIGTGIPTSPNVHEIVQEINPASNVVYVDNDPVVLAHARAFMRGTPEGRTTFIDADLRHPDTILQDPNLLTVLDASRPIGVLLIGIVHLLRDEDRPYEIVRRIIDWLPSGSFIAVSTPSPDFDPEMMGDLAQISEGYGVPCVPRSKPQLERFFESVDVLDPGIVPLLAWRPDTEPEDPNAVHGWVGLAQKV